MATLLLWQFTGMRLRLLLRGLWALANRRNRPVHGPGLIGRVARLGHLTLYLLMAMVLIIALLRAWGSRRVFSPFGFKIFPPRGYQMDRRSGRRPAWELAWLLGALILDGRAA